MRSKKIVFFFPAFSSLEATAPLGILAVATPLLRAGYQVRIIDSTITHSFQKQVLEELRDAICLAVSLVTGPMIRETVQIARETKRLYPDLPVILGGWHPSTMAEQSLKAPYIDIIVRGQGEVTFGEILDRLISGASLGRAREAVRKSCSAKGRNVLPASDSVNPLRDRANSETPRDSSRALMRALTAGWLTRRASAAR